MKRKVKVGIVGLGRSGWEIHANTLAKFPKMYEMKAVFDPIEERRQEAVNRFGCNTYSDFESIINDVDIELIIIATPNHLHSSQTIKALRAGKNVVCEKPMAVNLAEADAMIAACKDSGKILTIFHNRRYYPDFLKVKEVIASGKLGRIILIKIHSHSFKRRWDWQTLKKFGGGELRNNGPHFIDQALQLLGSNEPEVFYDLQKTLTLGDAEDHVKIVLKYPECPVIDIEITNACAYPLKKWMIMGTQGGLTGKTSSIRWKYFDMKSLPPRKVKENPTPNRSFNQEEIPWKEEIWHKSKRHPLISKIFRNKHDSLESGSYYFYEELYRTLCENTPLAITPESVRRAMWVIEKCLETNEKVDLKDLS